MNHVEVNSLIEQACLDFRLAISRNELTKVESFLDTLAAAKGLSAGDVRRLVIMLAQCEIEQLRLRGKTVEVDDFAKRFPDVEKEVFENLMSMPEIPAPVMESTLPARYTKVEKIGIGGIGEVWRVRDAHLDRTLAVKTLHSRIASSRAANRRLEREATITGQLQHPGVPPVYEQGQLSNGSRFFSMKLVEGNTLAAILRERRDDLPYLIGVFEQVAQTIAYAHSKGVVHRDIKPQNIMVGEFGEVQVMDWGMAKNDGALPLDPLEIDSGHLDSISSLETRQPLQGGSVPTSIGMRTRRGDILGTPAYMSPEQARGENEIVGPASDVFALGVVLFEILTGKRLLGELTAKETITKVASGSFDDVEQQLKKQDIAGELTELCSACLQFDFANRPVDASHVAAAIESYQSNVQNRLRQAELDRSAVEIKTVEQRKRNRIALALSLLVAATSLIGAVAFAWQWNKAMASAKEARLESDTRKELNDFLILDFLGSLNHDYESANENSLLGLQPDPDLKVRTVLDRAAAKVAERLAGRPGIEGEIRTQLCLSYFAVGELKLAQEQIEEAVVLLEKELGADHEKHLYALRLQAALEVTAGNARKGLEILQRIYPVYAAKEGLDSPNVVSTQSEIAAALSYLGRNKEAAMLVEQMIELETSLGREEVDLIELRLKQATALYNIEEYDRAQSALEKLLSSLDGIVGLDDEGNVEIAEGKSEFVGDFIAAIELLGKKYQVENQQDKAQNFFEIGLNTCRQCYGPNHPKTLRAIDNFATHLLHMERFEQARELLVVNVEKQANVLGPDHIVTLRSMNSLASAYVNLHELELAENTFEKIGEVLTDKFDKPVIDVILNKNNLAALYSRQEKFAEAEASYVEVAEGCEALMGPNSFQTLISYRSLAEMQLKQEKYSQAETGFLELLERCDGILPDNNPILLRARDKLLEVYVDSEQNEKAEKQVEELTSLYDETEFMNFKVNDSRERFALSLAKLNRFEDASHTFESVIDFNLNKYGPAGEKTIGAVLRMANLKIETEQWDDCLSHLEKYRNQLDPTKDAWQYLRLESKRGLVLFGKGETEEAETLLASTYEKQKQFDVPGSVLKVAIEATLKPLIELCEQTEQNEQARHFQALLDEQKPIGPSE